MTYDETRSPTLLLPLLRTSVERLLASAAALDDDDAQAPSRLPGWSRAHVLTHIARSADSRTRLLTAARTGADLPQYRDEAQREREIEEGAGRPAAELADDLDAALHQFLRAADGQPEDTWDLPVRWLGGGLRPVRGTIPSMLREVEVHHTDLATGHRPTDWPPCLVKRELARTAETLNDRPEAPAMTLLADEDKVLCRVGDGTGPQVSGHAAELLGWLTGRTDGTVLAVGPPGPLPSVPAWRS